MAKTGGREKGREEEAPMVPIPAVKMVPSVLERIEVVPVPRERWGGRPKMQRRGEGGFEFTDERFSADRDGVAATTGFLFPANFEGKQIYGMEYKLKDEALRFTYTITGRNPGDVRMVIPGAEHTVVITENTAMLVTGWAAWQRGEQEIVVDGQPQRDAQAISFGLSPLFQGDSLLSAGASYKDGMTTIFMMNRYGLLCARGVSLASILYADIQFEPSEGWQLLSAGDVALLVKDGSANAYVLSADFSGAPRIDVRTIILPEAVRGRAEIRRGEGAYTIVYNGGEAEITDSELHPQAQE